MSSKKQDKTTPPKATPKKSVTPKVTREGKTASRKIGPILDQRDESAGYVRDTAFTPPSSEKNPPPNKGQDKGTSDKGTSKKK